MQGEIKLPTCIKLYLLQQIIFLDKINKLSRIQRQLVQELLAHLAVARVMREDQLDVAGVVTGCSPAFFALFVDCLTRAGVEAGLPAADCREMVESTMRGVAEQLLTSGEHPRAYMEKVSSPGGTTIKATRALECDMFLATCDAVDAAMARTRELAGE
jgi:pyrroline-5-carboxylate reductase